MLLTDALPPSLPPPRPPPPPPLPSPPCGLTVTPLVHYRGCASELTQSGFSSGRARELRENQLVWCVTPFFSPRQLLTFTPNVFQC